ncbi:MAG: fibronectin type III domain-containing protein [Paludibacteraceae bacterium]|nr:fibronectin type III domain-containing protein [Paludibacteraceae bacterium]
MKNVVSNSLSSYLEKGTKVYDGEITTPATDAWYNAIEFTTDFEWDGTSNVLLTIYDKTGYQASNRQIKHIIYRYSSTDNTRCLYQNGTASYNIANITAITDYSTANYANQIQFDFEAGTPTPTYDAPTNVSVTAKSSSSATIGWTKKDDAKIKLQYSVKDAGSSWTTVENLTGASYTISGLSSETTYDYKVFAVYTEGTSDAVTGSFTTDAVSDHEHNGVSFQEWKETESLPTTEGSYYLKDNVTVSSWTVPTGDTKICLNGKTITYTHATSPITIGDSKSLSIYDNEGGGKITAGLNFAATIKVNGGTLSLYGGTIENTANGSDAFAVNVASGAFNIKGNVQMSTSAANINLASSKVITLTGALTNTTKLSVQKAANTNITSGWSTQMGTASPADYFTSANSAAPAVILVDGEAQLGMPSFEFSETGTYSSYPSGKTDVNLVRTFQGGILNTISLPFALTDEQMKEAFGEDYELYQLSSSALSNNILDVYFDKVTTLALGYPYLLRVSEDIVNPSFSSVTLGSASHRTSTDAIEMVSVVKAQQVTGSNYNLFLNASGELNWSTQDALFKGMRAYFQVKPGYRDAVAARRLVIRNTPTNTNDIDTPQMVEKTFEKGHLFIFKKGKKHTLQGQIIK